MSIKEVHVEYSPPADGRVVQIDVLRGVAVLGIYWINVMVFALPYNAYILPVLMGDATTANSLVWGFSEVFIEGSMRGLFSILFGASALLFLHESRLTSNGVDIVDRYYRRTMFLILFGLLHAWLLLWPYDVLYAYGLLGLFLFPLRKLSPRALIIIGVAFLLLGDLGINQFKPGKPISSIETDVNTHGSADNSESELSDRMLSSNIANQLEEEISIYRSGYWDIFNRQKSDVAEQQSIDMYDTHLFDIGGMMLIGMALLKLGILSGQREKDFYLQLLMLAYLCGFLIRAPDVYEALRHGFSLTRLLGHENTSYNTGRLAITLGHVGLIGLLCQTAMFHRIARSLAVVGRMALTNYIMQTLISIFIFFGFGLGKYAYYERYQLVLICLAIWLFQIMFSHIWLKYFYYGPLEWVWRSLVYGKRQQFVKANI